MCSELQTAVDDLKLRLFSEMLVIRFPHQQGHGQDNSLNRPLSLHAAARRVALMQAIEPRF